MFSQKARNSRWLRNKRLFSLSSQTPFRPSSNIFTNAHSSSSSAPAAIINNNNNRNYSKVTLGDAAFQKYLKERQQEKSRAAREQHQAMEQQQQNQTADSAADTPKQETLYDPNAPFAFPSEEEILLKRKNPFIVPPKREINIDELIEPKRPTRASADRQGVYKPPHQDKTKLTEQELQEVFEYNQKMRKIYSQEMSELRKRESEGEAFSVPSLVIRLKDMQRYAAKICAKGYKQWRPVDQFPEILQPQDLEEAFQVQRAITEEMGYQVAGWKVGCSSKTAQEERGLDQPFIGPMYEKFVWQSPTTINMDKLINFSPMVEVEVGFVMGGNLSIENGTNEDGSPKLRDEPFTIEEVARDIRAVVPIIEIVGSRLDPFITKERNVFTKIADGGSNVGCVLGKPNTEMAEKIREDPSILKNIKGILHIDGNKVAEGESSTVHEEGPLGSATWAANFLRTQGHFLRPGDILASGTLTPPERVGKNDEVQVEYSNGLGSVEVTFKGNSLVNLKKIKKKKKVVTRDVSDEL